MRRERGELASQRFGEVRLQFGDGAGVDAREPLPAALVQRHRVHLVQQILGHAAQPEHLRRVQALHHVGGVTIAHRRDGRPPNSGVCRGGGPCRRCRSTLLCGVGSLAPLARIVLRETAAARAP